MGERDDAGIVKASLANFKTSQFAQSLRQAQILIRGIHNVCLWLHEVKRQRHIFAFLDLEQN